MRLPGVHVSSYPTANGAVLVFSKVTGSLSELRERSWSVAEMYDRMEYPDETQVTPEAWPAPPAPTRVEVTEQPNGMFLQISAVHDRDIDDVQDHLLSLARVMRESGDCPNVLPRSES